VHYTPEPMRNSKLPVKDEMDPAHQPVDESKPLGRGAGHRPALFEEPQAFEPEKIHQTSDNNDSISMWPSEIHNMGDTTWLLPAYSDQSSTLASVLRTEIQSHNITREMLHNTERRRLEGAQRCKHLQADIERWAAAYNNLTATFARCAEEFSRLSAENLELKTKLNASPVRHFCAHVLITYLQDL
jgi:septal ring factor EnvC (AmiA/AmiB activator)